MSLSQTAIMERAERLAGALAGGPTRVEKNVLLSVVADFMSDPRADLDRLRRTVKLLQEGSGGHLKRSASYAQQIEAVAAGLKEVLADPGLSRADFKSLFGWTARLLLVRGEGPPADLPQTVSSSGPKAGPRKEPAKRSIGGIGQKGLSTLEKLKQDLERKEKG